MSESDFKTVKPTPNYQLQLPVHVSEEVDGQVQSFWMSKQPLLLQLSSYVRTKGRQVTAATRMRQRMAKHANEWKLWNTQLLNDPRVDQQTAEYLDSEGILWVHSYLVWPHLTIYSLISGPPDLVHSRGNWAMEGVKSLQLVIH